MNQTPAGNLYVVHVINLPGSIRGAVASTGDEIYHVFLNDALAPDQRLEALDHEIRHIDGNHLCNDVMPIGQMERVAAGHAPQERYSFANLDPAAKTIPYYKSLSALQESFASVWEGGPADPKTDEPVREDG